MAKLTEAQIKELIKSDLSSATSSELFEMANDYNVASNYGRIYRNTQMELIELCNDNLSEYFEQIKHSSHYDKDDDYFVIDGYNWIKSISDITDVVDLDALVDFVFDNYDDYEDYLPETSSAIEEAEDEDEDEEDEEEEE